MAFHFGDGALKGRSVAVQGLGNVGYNLAKFLREAGAKVFAADINPAATDRARAELGSRSCRRPRSSPCPATS